MTLSLMMEAFAEAWVVSNPLYTFMANDSLDLGTNLEEEEGERDEELVSLSGSDRNDDGGKNLSRKDGVGGGNDHGADDCVVFNGYRDSDFIPSSKNLEPSSNLKKNNSRSLLDNHSTEISKITSLKLNSPLTASEAFSPPSKSPPLDTEGAVSNQLAGSPDKTSVSHQRAECPDEASNAPSSRSCGYLTYDVIIEDISDRSNVNSPSNCSSSPSSLTSMPKSHPNTVIPSSTKCKDLIPFLLLKLGYLTNKAYSPNADILLIVRQWSPISVKSLCKSGSQSLEELVHPISSIGEVFLKIVIESWKTKDLVFKWNNEAVRTTLTSLLRHYSQKKLAALCPFSQAYISIIARDNNSVVISQSKCLEFGTWFEKFTKKVISSAAVSAEDVCPNKTPNGARRCEWSKTAVNTSNSDSHAASLRHIISGCGKSSPSPTLSSNDSDSVLDAKPLQISFHAQLELPQLKRWYSASPSPPEAELESFVIRLNESEWRRSGDRIRVTKDKLRNWWKNERARRKRMREKEREQNGEERRMEEGKEEVKRKKRKEKNGVSKIAKEHEICYRFGQAERNKIEKDITNVVANLNETPPCNLN